MCQRDSWLEIIARYLVTKRDDKKRITGVLFPRYHQLDATRKLVQAVRAEGVGQKYLIQHSAFEVERVVQVALNPKVTPAQLVAAIEPVADRLLKRFKAASEAFKAASEKLPGGEVGPDDLAAKDLQRP